MSTNTATPTGSKFSGEVDLMVRRVTLEALTHFMFDRYAGDNNTQLEPEQKLYFMSDLKTIALPAINIMSFLSSVNTTSAPKRLMGKKGNSIAQACLSYVTVEGDVSQGGDLEMIPFMRGGKPIVFGKFQGDRDPVSGIEIRRHVARLPKGIPNPKVRPVLINDPAHPWTLTFILKLYPNNEVKEELLQKLFKDGGVALGLGTWRGVFGKFVIGAWDAI